MKLFKEHRVISLILIISVLASCVVMGQRMSAEASSNNVDFILDYNEMELLAKQSDEDLSWWFEEFADMKIKKVGLYEETLLSLAESDKPVKAELVTDFRKDAYLVSQAPAEVLQMIEENVQDDYDVIVIAESPEMFNFINRAFQERFDPKRSHSIATENGGYILIDGEVSDSLYIETQKLLDTEDEGFREINEMSKSLIMYLNLGLLPEKIDLIKNAGCTVEPRTVGYSGWDDNRFFDDVIKQYELLDVQPTYWILASDEVPGYDDGTGRIKKYLTKNDIMIGVVENTTQRENMEPDGLSDVILDSDYNVVRIFSVWPYIQYRYEYYGYDSYQEVENSLFRAVVERNIRVVYYKPMKDKDDNYTYITDIQDYRDSFANLETRLAEHDITVGEASAMDKYQVSIIFKILAAIGAGCAALLCLRAVFPINKKWMWILFGLGCLGVLGAYYVAPNMSGILTSFASATILPCLGTVWILHEGMNQKQKMNKDAGVFKLILKGILVLLGGVFFALAGAVMTAAPISSINFLLELDIFRGVKLAQLLPLAFFALMFLIMALRLWGNKTKETLEVSDVKWIINYNIKVWMVILGLVVAVAGYIYLARTGHESGVEASSFELLARNYLEEILYARPRTKEFMVAFPAIILFIYSMVRDFKIFSFLFGMAGVIGLTSIVNTFMHIRTPLDLGFARTAYSIVFGIILGVIYALIIEGVYRLLRKRGKNQNAS